jgi:FkbM family methyltransferase
MKPHLTHLLKNYEAIYNKSKYTLPILIDISYTWGSYGWIRFEANGLLVTKWVQGSYEWVSLHSLYASWAGITHFLQFNQDYSSFMSVRLGDLEYVKGKKQMIFLNEHGRKIDINKFETVEQSQTEHYITEDSVVLELGARYGTVSCVINKKLKNKFNQVSVEPDSSVWECLEKNMQVNGCKFNLIKGVISMHPLELVNVPYGYGNTTIKSESSSLAKYTLDQVEQQYNLSFDTLVADCEGFLGQFFEENPRLYEQLKLVIFEKDNPTNCNYTSILENLKTYGFTNLVSGFHEVWKKV